MLYGVILESARDGIILSYGLNIWKRIVNQLELPSDEFDLFTHYNDQLLLNICDCEFVNVENKYHRRMCMNRSS